MTMYQSLLMVLMSLPFRVLGLSTQIFDELTEVHLQGYDFLMSESQQLIILTC